jgi:hypothetical protein
MNGSLKLMSCEHWIRTNQPNSSAILAKKRKNQKNIFWNRRPGARFLA